MLRRVVIQTSRPTRARNAEEKQRRRSQILAAAERLWQTSSYSDLSMNQVAREANLAKGTLYLYFATKEELFLALLNEHLHDWFQEMHRLLAQHPPRTADEIATLIIDSARNRESLRRLLMLLGTVLERNVSPENLRYFYRSLRQRVQPILKQLPIKPEQGLSLLISVYALTVGWHQVTATKMHTPSDDAFGLPGQYRQLSFEQGFGANLRAIVQELTVLPTPTP